MTPLRLTLYVAGSSARSRTALAAAQELGVGQAPRVSALEVVDVEREPARAAADGVLLTPALMVAGQGPERRVFGDLSDPLELAWALDLRV